ncbi:MAG TPA: TPM domain-containing protein [Gemmatimonadales bacterium]
MLSFILLAFVAQVQAPAPVGYVNDFADVIPPETERFMLAVIDEVRTKSGGEIVVVTLPDLAGRPSIEVARDIGRQWRVGAQGGAGDQARNAGVILLLQPGQRPGDGLADLAIATGSGAEGFITDARAGRIRDAIGQAAVERGNYADGLLVGVAMLGHAYAEEFHFELTGAGAQVRVRRQPSISPGSVGMLVSLIALFVMFAIVGSVASSRGGRGRFRRAGGLQWLLLSLLLGGRGGGRSRGGWGGGGGFGGGGFGGFGGGGGFSGGGASGRF